MNTSRVQVCAPWMNAMPPKAVPAVAFILPILPILPSCLAVAVSVVRYRLPSTNDITASIIVSGLYSAISCPDFSATINRRLGRAAAIAS